MDFFILDDFYAYLTELFNEKLIFILIYTGFHHFPLTGITDQLIANAYAAWLPLFANNTCIEIKLV